MPVTESDRQEIRSIFSGPASADSANRAVVRDAITSQESEADNVSLGASLINSGSATARSAISVLAAPTKSQPFMAETIRRTNRFLPGTLVATHMRDGSFSIPAHVPSDSLPQERLIFKLTEALEQKAQSFFPLDPRLRESFVFTKAPAAIGSGLGFVALTLASGGAGGSAMTRSMLLGGSSLGIEEAQRAIDEGLSSDLVLQRFNRNFAIGLTEGIPIGRLLDRAGSGKFLSNLILAGTEEGMQEGIQNVLSNVAAGRPWGEGVPESILLGMIAGVSISGSVDVATRLRGKALSKRFQQEFQNAAEKTLAGLDAQEQSTSPPVDIEVAETVIENASNAIKPNADVKARLDAILDIYAQKRTGAVDINLVGEQSAAIVKLFKEESESEFLKDVPDDVIAKFEELNRDIMKKRAKIAQQRFDLNDKIRELQDKDQTAKVKAGINKLQGQIDELSTKPDKLFAARIQRGIRGLFKADNLAAQKSLIKAINGIGTETLSPLQREQIEAITKKLDLAKPTDQTLEALDATLRQLAENPDSVFPAKTIKGLERLIKQPVSDLSGEDARILEKVIQHAQHLSKTKDEIKGRLEKSESDKDTLLAQDELQSDGSILSPNPRFKSGQVQTRERFGYLRTVFGRLGQMTLDSLGSLAGGGDGSVVHKVLATDVQDAQHDAFTELYEAIDTRDQSIKDNGLDPGGDEVAAWSAEISGEKNKMLHDATFGRVTPQTRAKVDLFTDSNGSTIPMTSAQRMGLVAMVMDPSTHDIVLFHKNKDGSRGLKLKLQSVPVSNEVGTSQTGATEANSDTIQLNVETLSQLKNSLSPQQLSIVGSMVSHLNSDFKQKMKAWSLKNKGIDITNQDTWFPRHRFFGEDTKPPIELNAGNFAKVALENSSILQERTGGDAPLEIRDIFVEYNNTVMAGSGILHLSESINKAKTLLKTREVSSVLESSRNGKRVRDAFNTFYDSAAAMWAGGTFSPQDAVSSTVREVARKITRGSLAFNPRVATYQLVSLSMLKTEMRSSDVNRAILEGAGFNADYDRRKAKDATIRNRTEGSNQGLINLTSEGGAQFGGEIKSRKRSEERGFGGIRWMDNMVIRIAWASAEIQAMRETGNTDRLSDSIQNRTGEIARKVINRTQPTFDPLSIPLIGVEARRKPLLRALTMFRAQRSKNIDMTIRKLTQATKDPTRENVLGAAREISEIWLLNSLRIAVIQEAFSFAARLGKPDDDEDPVSTRMVRRVLSVATGNLLLGGPLSWLADKSLQSALELAMDQDLNDPYDPAFSPISSMAIGAVTRAPGRLSGIEDSMSLLLETERLVEDFGPLLGIPVTPLRESRKVLESLLDDSAGGGGGSAF